MGGKAAPGRDHPPSPATVATVACGGQLGHYKLLALGGKAVFSIRHRRCPARSINHPTPPAGGKDPDHASRPHQPAAGGLRRRRSLATLRHAVPAHAPKLVAAVPPPTARRRRPGPASP